MSILNIVIIAFLNVRMLCVCYIMKLFKSVGDGHAQLCDIPISYFI